MLQSTQETRQKATGKTAQVRIPKEQKRRLAVLALALNQNEGELIENMIQEAWDAPANQYAIAVLAEREGA